MLEQEINNALNTLRAGGTILYPTDTVWGIGCDATNKGAIEKIFRIKQREDSKCMLMLVSDDRMLNRYVKEVPFIAWDLIDAMDKPLTIIYDEIRGIAPNAIAQDGSAGFRIASDEFCRKLISKFGKPIISTSANITGIPTPHNFSEINPAIIQAVDYVVNFNQHNHTKASASSIIKLKNNGEFVILRK